MNHLPPSALPSPAPAHTGPASSPARPPGPPPTPCSPAFHATAQTPLKTCPQPLAPCLSPLNSERASAHSGPEGPPPPAPCHRSRTSFLVTHPSLTPSAPASEAPTVPYTHCLSAAGPFHWLLALPLTCSLPECPQPPSQNSKRSSSRPADPSLGHRLATIVCAPVDAPREGVCLSVSPRERGCLSVSQGPCTACFPGRPALRQLLASLWASPLQGGGRWPKPLRDRLSTPLPGIVLRL